MAMTASSLSFKAQVANAVSTTAPKRATLAKAPMCVASAGRRDVLKVATFTTASVFANTAFAGANDYDIIDDRKANQNGLQNIYQARDLDIDQQTRPGEATRFNLQRLTPADTKKRVAEAVSRIKTTVPGLVEKEFYPVAQRELRSIVGYLRFDLEFLAALTSNKKASAQKVKVAIDAIEDFDFQLRSKSADGSKKTYAAFITALDTALADCA